MRGEWRFIIADSGVPFVHIIIQMLMHESSAKNWVILMLELDPCQHHLKVAQQTNRFGFLTFTAKEVRHRLQIVITTCHGILECLPVPTMLMICLYLVLMVSVYTHDITSVYVIISCRNNY